MNEVEPAQFEIPWTVDEPCFIQVNCFSVGNSKALRLISKQKLPYVQDLIVLRVYFNEPSL